MIHTESHPLAGKTVKLKPKASTPHDGVVLDAEYVIEDWWDKLTGKSWQDSDGNFATIKYAIRMGLGAVVAVPLDDEVVYGKINGLGHLIHESELGEVV